MTFDDACRCATQSGGGIGYVLTADDPFACIDLDVKEETPSEQVAFFHKIIHYVDSYTERSRSGKGFHVWLKGSIGKGAKQNGLEVYSQERFMICTGDVIHARTVEARQTQIDEIVGKMREEAGVAEPLPSGPERESDDIIRTRAHGAANGAKFAAHFSGDWQAIGHTDHSRADASLIQMLATYSANNEQVKRLFFLSALGQRGKSTTRKDYLDRTIAKARGHQANEAMDVEHGRSIAAQIMVSALLKGEIRPPKAFAESGALRLVAASEIASRPPMKWLVRDVLPESGVGAIFGPSGSGKSFLVLDLLAAVAGGYYWFGRKTKAVSVVYIALEGQAGLPQRIRACQMKRGTLGQIAFIEQQLDLQKPETLQQLVILVREAGLAGGVLCIDTLAASAPGMDENTSADMGKLIAGLQELQTKLGGFVLVVHHTGKDAGRGLRGWSGLTGALDCAIEVSRTVNDDKQNPQRQWEISKSKDGQDGISSPFMLEVVQVGTDEEGFPISSCVIGHCDQEDRAPATERDAETDEIIWGWIRNEVEKGNRPSGRSVTSQWLQIAPHLKPTQKQIRESIARLSAAKRIVSEKDGGNPWFRAIDGVAHA